MLNAELVALAEHLKARGLGALSPVRAPLADCRAMNERIGAVLNEGLLSVPWIRCATTATRSRRSSTLRTWPTR
jgi:hypothetical protein